MNEIKHIGNYLSKTLSKIDGFDYRWYSLITSEPLLFEDIDYYRCRAFVDNIITPEELEAYRRGELQEVYYTFETMLMCNLKHFDRIISLCTIAFLNYIRIGNTTTTEHLKQVPTYLSLTPTKIWCMSMCGIQSTEWELNYAWSVSKRSNIIDSSKIVLKEYQSIFEASFQTIYKRNILFRRFVEYASYRCNTQGFIKTKIQDITNSRRLSEICSKFTRTSLVFDEEKLRGITNLIKHYDSVENSLHKALSDNLTTMYVNQNEFAIYIFQNEFYIHSKKFKMVIAKRKKPIKTTNNDTSYIAKEYISNSYECFVAESKMGPSIKEQIKWAKNKLPSELEMDLQQLYNILLIMLKTDYKQIVCYKKTNKPNVYSKVIFSGIFNNVYVNEFMYAGSTLVHETKHCLSKENAARYLVERGYYMFGTSDDINDILSGKLNLIEHYAKYCIPILTHMKDIQELHYKNNQEIIEVLINRKVDDSKLVVVENYTTLKGSKRSIKQIMHAAQPQTIKENKLNYYQAIK